ncbi:hypothetical protein Bbelb_383140 [Branchiostoma belcheri]|nr:hypothetical protein Bbelb_383140 [Branchiostoma belcheri]
MAAVSPELISNHHGDTRWRLFPGTRVKSPWQHKMVAVSWNSCQITMATQNGGCFLELVSNHHGDRRWRLFPGTCVKSPWRHKMAAVSRNSCQITMATQNGGCFPELMSKW